jgi:hypothetical protein
LPGVSGRYMGEAGGTGIRSSAHGRGRLLWVGMHCFVNPGFGTQALWQPRMGPAPGHPHHLPARDIEKMQLRAAMIWNAPWLPAATLNSLLQRALMFKFHKKYVH